MILRDHLAENRTTLANERTLLAYVRTALTLFIAGVTFIKFFNHVMFVIIGWILIPLSVLTIVKGLISFRKMKVLIKKEELRGDRD